MNDNLLQPGFNPGGHVDRYDERDYKWSDIGASVAPFDWSTEFDIEQKLGLTLPTKDQNGSLSCGGQAMSQYMGVKEAIATKTFEERSAKFIYSQTFVPGGGTAGRDLCNLVVNQGSAKESVLSSYDGGQPPTEVFMERTQDITQTARDDAKLTRALSYATVDFNIDSFAQAISENDGMLVGICGANNGTWRSQFPMVAPFEWRHWMYFGKALMFDGKKYIVGKQSWGSGIGLNGWQYFGEEWFTSGNIFGGWTLVFNNQSTVPSAFSHNFTVDIKFGSKGDEVVALQKALKIDGEFTYPSITGFYGSVTQAAVSAFQKKYNIPDSGTNGTIVGPKTRLQLNSLFNK